MGFSLPDVLLRVFYPPHFLEAPARAAVQILGGLLIQSTPPASKHALSCLSHLKREETWEGSQETRGPGQPVSEI